MTNPTTESFLRLLDIMDDLREKCPWDKKQTIQTLRQLTIEETYELADAVSGENWKDIKEELGDLLLHIVFYAKIGTEKGQFTIIDVINGICDKLVARHPHIYGDVTVQDEEEVKRNWEKLKLKEGKTSVIGGVPASLPATIKAMRLQEKAKQTGFEWDNKDQVWEKVEEEIAELKAAVEARDAAVAENKEILQAKAEEEFGDVVFSLINYARFLQMDAENALERTNKKFIHRFTQMEKKAMQHGKNLNEMTLQEMDAIWNEIKQQRQDQ